MNLLFIHGSFPGQFLKLAPFLSSKTSGRTVFLTQSTNPQNLSFPGVEIVRFECHRNVSKGIHDYLSQPEQCVLRGQAVVKALDQLLQQGFKPDVVISHAAMGFGMYIKALLPNVRLISYVEWFFQPETSTHLFSSFSINDNLRIRTYMWPLVEEMQQADDLVCPTHWQRSQFPLPWRERIQVIFDGIDEQCFQPIRLDGELLLETGTTGHKVDLKSGEKILAYATRGMEPLRGFPEFMRAAALAQQSDPKVQVVIAGHDRVAYSYKSAHSSGSWKQQMLEELSGQLDLSRLHFPGLLQYGELAKLMQRSDLYCYFTRPYVVSWSVFEAAACGSRMLVNQFGGIDEVFHESPFLGPVDLDDQEQINRAVLKGLSMDWPRDYIQSLLPPGMGLSVAQDAWLKLLNG